MVFVHNSRLWLRAMAVTLAVLAICECALLALVAIRARTMDAPKPADCMIVLGGGIDRNTSKPLSTLAYRLDRARELYDAGYAPSIIVSGGQGGDEPISEAQSMRDYLIGAGVPDAAIIMEDRSTNTWENMVFSNEIMDARGFNDALVVTSDYHLWRSLKLAECAGISASGAGAKNSRTVFHTVKNLARETLSLLKFALNGQ